MYQCGLSLIEDCEAETVLYTLPIRICLLENPLKTCKIDINAHHGGRATKTQLKKITHGTTNGLLFSCLEKPVWGYPNFDSDIGSILEVSSHGGTPLNHPAFQETPRNGDERNSSELINITPWGITDQTRAWLEPFEHPWLIQVAEEQLTLAMLLLF